MKTKEELNALKEEVETLNKKLAELSEDELKAVSGGNSWDPYWGEDGFINPGGGTSSPTEDDNIPGGSKWGPYWGE